MRKMLLILTALVVAASLLAAPVVAQMQTDKQTPGPPKILQIIREEVKPGKTAAHDKHEAAWTQALVRAKFPAYTLTVTTVTGPSESWFLSGFDSWAEMAKVEKAVENGPSGAVMQQFGPAEAEYVNNTRSLVASYVEDLSYRPNFNIGEYRYFMVDMVRVKPGYGNAFADRQKLINAAHEKAGLDEHMVVYTINNGAPFGTYLIFQPLKSLEEVDDMAKMHGKDSAYSKAYSEEDQKKMQEFAKEGLISTQRDFVAFRPSMSYLPKDVVAAAPDFWTPKKTMAASGGTVAGHPKPAAKKEPAKQ